MDFMCDFARSLEQDHLIQKLKRLQVINDCVGKVGNCHQHIDRFFLSLKPFSLRM